MYNRPIRAEMVSGRCKERSTYEIAGIGRGGACRDDRDGEGQDLAAGEQSFRKCRPAIRSARTRRNKVGPELNGLDGRKSGTVDGLQLQRRQQEGGHHLERGDRSRTTSRTRWPRCPAPRWPSPASRTTRKSPTCGPIWPNSRPTAARNRRYFNGLSSSARLVRRAEPFGRSGVIAGRSHVRADVRIAQTPEGAQCSALLTIRIRTAFARADATTSEATRGDHDGCIHSSASRKNISWSTRRPSTSTRAMPEDISRRRQGGHQRPGHGRIPAVADRGRDAAASRHPHRARGASPSAPDRGQDRGRARARHPRRRHPSDRRLGPLAADPRASATTR